MYGRVLVMQLHVFLFLGLMGPLAMIPILVLRMMFVLLVNVRANRLSVMLLAKLAELVI
jgi:hypothetical protein